MRSAKAALDDILKSIAKIETYLAGMSLEAFAGNAMVQDAVIRNLEVISEASRSLSEDDKNLYPDIPWRSVAGIGNVLRHSYDVVSIETIWNTAILNLPDLKHVAQALAYRYSGENGHERS